MANSSSFLSPLPDIFVKGLHRPPPTSFEKFHTAFNDDGKSFGHVHFQLNKMSKRKVQRPARHTKKRLSLRERRRLGLYTLGNKSIAYQQLEKINHIWKEYMRELLQINGLSEWTNDHLHPQFEQISLKLQRADYHGASISVIKSSCPSLVGCSGIVAMETRDCFRIVGKDDVCRTVPKKNCQFKITLDTVNFTFYGKNLMIRPAERSNKKVKMVKPSCID